MDQLISNVFLAPRVPEDLDLIQCVTQILMELGHPTPGSWESNPVLADAMNANPKLQRFLINRHWRTVLGMSSENTTRERYCLLDTGEDTEYLQIFRDAVGPTIVKLGLV